MSVLTLESLAEAFAKKDSEIARLKDTLGRSTQLHHELDAEIHRLKRDLADAVQNIQSMIVDASEKDSEIERLSKIAKEQYAEIKRLKADVEYWHHIATVEKNGLITELAAVVDSAQVLMGWSSYDNLLQRVRDATREDTR